MTHSQETQRQGGGATWRLQVPEGRDPVSVSQALVDAGYPTTQDPRWPGEVLVVEDERGDREAVLRVAVGGPHNTQGDPGGSLEQGGGFRFLDD